LKCPSQKGTPKKPPTAKIRVDTQLKNLLDKRPGRIGAGLVVSTASLKNTFGWQSANQSIADRQPKCQT
jgi:hypothetical protein